MKKMIVYISLIFIFVALPAKSWAQYVVISDRIERPCDGPLIYTDGMPRTAQWELGRKLYDVATKATIRHNVNGGNGNNLNVNSKVPIRFILAPTDASMGGSMSWAHAMGFADADNNNMNSMPSTGSGSWGCANYRYNNYGYQNITNWRLPTQREFFLIYLLSDIIDQAVQDTGASYFERLSGNYWTSTEFSATSAYYFLINSTPVGFGYTKTTNQKVRCVADF